MSKKRSCTIFKREKHIILIALVLIVTSFFVDSVQATESDEVDSFLAERD